MTSVRIGDVVLGAGRPKVCVPLTGATIEALETEARAVRAEVADLVELRVDRFDGLHDPEAVGRAVDAVRAALDPALPILLTVRSAREGGGADLPSDAVTGLLAAAARHPGVAAVDVEMAEPSAAAAIEAIRAAGKPVVTSFHDFAAMPSHDEIVERLVRQSRMGGDVVKLAAMPGSTADVLTLLAATAEYSSRPDARPAITMAMGPLGVVSRLAGETVGSCLTFGTVGAASAPGQVDAGRLRDALDLIHDAQQR